VVRQVEYLANPQVLHKNQNILTLLLQNVFSKLDNKAVLKEVTRKMQELVNDSY